jgi:hypothetical protein
MDSGVTKIFNINLNVYTVKFVFICKCGLLDHFNYRVLDSLRKKNYESIL